jgi:hypothetical protein
MGTSIGYGNIEATNKRPDMSSPSSSSSEESALRQGKDVNKDQDFTTMDKKGGRVNNEHEKKY